MRILTVTTLILSAALLQADDNPAAVGEPAAAGALRSLCAGIVKENKKSVVVGRDGWVFLRSDLRHVSVGRFWGDAAMKTSQASSATKKDPLPAIVDYNERLQALGIKLYFMPIPSKAAVYPDKLPGKIDWDPKSKIRLDTVHEEFYRKLEKEGVSVIDIMPLLLEARLKQDAQVFCRRDSHYSGEACELISAHLAKVFKGMPWLSAATPVKFKAVRKSVKIKGDLAQMADVKSSQALETLRLRVITGTGLKNPNSPLLLFGDSHNLVFDSGGEMHATSAGLASQLAFDLGIGIDVVGVFGSGATPSRINIMRRASRDATFLKEKKVFVWCLSAREFTEGSGWSAKIPVKR